MDLGNETNRLKALGLGPHTPEARGELIAALESKHEGLQVTAGRILADWGGPESLSALQAWLFRCADRPAGWSAFGQAAKALARCFDPTDAPWVLDLYFLHPGSFVAVELLPLLRSLPPEGVAARLEAESRSPDRAVRLASLNLAARLQPPGAVPLIRQLARDQSLFVAKRAARELRRLTRRCS